MFVAVIRVAELGAEVAVMTGGDATMGAGEALGSPVLEKTTVEASGLEGNTAGLATGNPVLEKMTVELIGFEGDAAGIATGIPVLEKITVELSGFEGVCDCMEAGSGDETAGDNTIGPGATNIDVVLLAEGITATGVIGATTVGIVLGRGVTDAARGLVTALEIGATIAERAVMGTGGSACGGSRIDGERAVVVTGSTVATTPSIIVIVV